MNKILKPCPYCNGEGIVEMDNNGPIGKCPMCKGTGKDTRQSPNKARS